MKEPQSLPVLADTINALETWLIATIVFVFGSLVEYAIAVAIDGLIVRCKRYARKAKAFLTYKRGTRLVASPEPETIEVKSQPEVTTEPEEAGGKGNNEEKEESHVHLYVDIFSMILFPILFFIYNIYYWGDLGFIDF